MKCDDIIQELTEQMIKNNFENRGAKEKYIITKQDLYEFSIKLIKVIKGIEER